jgi:hypothetical protein
MSGSKSGGGFGSSGGGIILYGVILRDKAQSADPETLRAYKVVAEDLLATHGGAGADVEDLRAALEDVNRAISRKGK